MPAVQRAGKPHEGLANGAAAGSGAPLASATAGVAALPTAPAQQAVPPAAPLPYVILQRSHILGRRPVALHPDAVPECCCAPDWQNAGRGCDPETCLNAAVRTECTPGHCACGDACGNQRMLRSQNAPIGFVPHFWFM